MHRTSLPFWLMMVSEAMTVLPVWRSPMISSRWPRPMGDHRVDGPNAGLQRLLDRLAVQDAGSRGFDGTVIGGFDGAFAVDGLAKGVDYRPIIPHRHGRTTLPLRLVLPSLIRCPGPAERWRAVIFLRFWANWTALGHAVVQAGGTGNTVADHCDSAGLTLCSIAFW